ncbi:MAG: cation transporter [Sulfobacillus benefaciens]|uniref:Cation transporter n=1 Tax=Sulfobacillus benefaciens TaxID=453960 RepID=A0A2T2XEI4_9FIRM|nr:MAG: cation transporter [Sulfobacillus benefaciens]
MAHHHAHEDASPIGRTFAITALLLIIKVAGAILSGSLALWADAGHSVTDLAAVGLSWYAWHQAKKPATSTLTFGYFRSEILAALVNSVILLILTLGLLLEAIMRFFHPTAVNPFAMLITAVIALGGDLYLAHGLKGHANVNIRSTWLHIVSDAAGSFAVVIGAIVIATTGWTPVDPMLTILIAALISWGAWQIITETVAVLMEATPKNLDVHHLVATMGQIEGIIRVHDVHVWSVTTGKNALACHVVLAPNISMKDSQTILRQVDLALRLEGIEHMTIQMETSDADHDEPSW